MQILLLIIIFSTFSYCCPSVCLFELLNSKTRKRKIVMIFKFGIPYGLEAEHEGLGLEYTEMPVSE